jgi:DNA-binding CsgD family transcriptional regulator
MNRVRASQLEATVGRIYQAAVDPRLWGTVLDEIADAIGAGSAAIFGSSVKPSVGYFNSPGGDEFFHWLAGEGQYVHNPRPERAMRMSPRRRAITDGHLFTDWETAHIPFNVEMTRRGFHREAGIVGIVDGAPLIFSCQRSLGDERFGPAELEAIEAIFPHLERAAHIAARFSRERTDGMLDTFERMACGGILLSSDGRVVRMNAHAETLVGVCLNIIAGRLSAIDTIANEDLQRLIREVGPGVISLQRGMAAPFAPLPRHSGRPLAVYAMPLVAETPDLFQRAHAILAIVDPDANRDVGSDFLARVYRLTPAELRLANALAKGGDVKEISEIFGISLHTARTQLKSLMAKTGTSRQSDLIALLIKASFGPVQSRR